MNSLPVYNHVLVKGPNGETKIKAKIEKETTMDEREKEVRAEAANYILGLGTIEYGRIYKMAEHVKRKHSGELYLSGSGKAKAFDRMTRNKCAPKSDEHRALLLLSGVLDHDSPVVQSSIWYPSEDDTVTAELVREECGVKFYKVDGEMSGFGSRESNNCGKITVSAEANINGDAGMLVTIAPTDGLPGDTTQKFCEVESIGGALKLIGIDEVVE